MNPQFPRLQSQLQLFPRLRQMTQLLLQRLQHRFPSRLQHMIFTSSIRELTEELASQILEKCKAEGMDSADLKIYVKPEDKKAYYACAGGNSYIEL